MTETKRTWTDQQVEEILGNLLRIGVILATVVVLAGGVFYLIRYGTALPDYRVFQGEPTDLRSVSGIVQNVLELRRRGTIQFGLLLLIATPVARVIFSVFAFWRQGDRVYVFITLFVLFVPGDGCWNLGVVDMARELASRDALVVDIDIKHYLKQLE